MKHKSIYAIAAMCCLASVQTMAQKTLGEATKGKFLFGTAVNMQQVNGVNAAESAIIASEFSAIVAENDMKPQPIHPAEDRFNWDNADKIVAFAEKNKQTLTGHCLIWHSQVPNWFFVGEDGKPATPEVLKERMRKHIHAVVGRYKGKIKGWDVVNEAFEDNGSYRNSKFYQILGKDFIKYAFQFAHEADPNAELYYNDYNVETPSKCDAIVQLVKELKAAGLRIDAVGSQSHMHMINPTVEAAEASFKKLKAAGVHILITEWDISILPSPYEGANISTNFSYSKEMDPYRDGVPADVQAKWNKRMLDMFNLFLKYDDVIDRVTVWGVTDNGTWLNGFPIRGRMDYPMLFDRNNKRKPIVDQMIKLAKKYKTIKKK
ncbi:Endo-1,4-beta-xylanase [Paludibacter propionicigenes WB4]|uniref:Beta-xylanase n=1 Tax=Paludibacter propionicigenes (strain DSM 17365 / JCM 13257 / WB4) TaxID=694427 RepID=E4T4Y6_PALPW|nr:endo-1,4-beta-xylanase [Paludibacter propionicigenes]ADQ79780.1 Endo-1,4-beta-xylanase [Paludibacter propionicigenes WB4]